MSSHSLFMDTNKTLSPAAVVVLSASARTPDRLTLPPDRLSKSLYAEINNALQMLGGEWVSREAAHLFSSPYANRLDALLNGGPLPVRNPGAFFATPDTLAAAVLANSSGLIALPAGARVLEPSVGQCALVRALRSIRNDLKVEGCEIDEINSENAEQSGVSIVAADFLTLPDVATYDAIIMNPPFAVPDDRSAWITHVEKALRLLKAGGVLVAIVPEALKWQGKKRIAALRARFECEGAILTNPEGAFKESGTAVKTVTAYLGGVAVKTGDVMQAAKKAGDQKVETAALAMLDIAPTIPHAQAVREVNENQKLIQRVGVILPQASTMSALFETWAPHNAATHLRLDDHPTWCSIGYNLGDHHLSFSVRVRPEVWEEIKSHRVISDPGYFEIVNWGDGFARVFWKYNQILGQKLVAVIEIRSIAAAQIIAPQLEEIAA